MQAFSRASPAAAGSHRQPWAETVLRLATTAALALLSVAGDSVAAPLSTGCAAGQFPLAIDVGHGPEAGGAQSARGVPEFAFNQRLAAAVQGALLAHGFQQAALIDPDGRGLSLQERVARTRRLAPNLLISIHHDSVQPGYLREWSWEGRRRRYSDRFRGFSLFVSRDNGDFAASLAFAKGLGRRLVDSGFSPSLHHAEDIDGERRPLLDADAGAFAGDRLAVLAHDAAPAVLIEAGIIVNRDEERMLDQPAFRQRFAAAVVAAVEAFCAQHRQ